MSEKKDKVTSLRLDEDKQEILETLCEKYNLSKPIIIGKLLFLCEEYSLLEPNFIEKLIQSELNFYIKKEEIRLKSETYMHDLREGSKDRDRQITVKLAVLKEFLATRTDQEKRAYFDHEMHLERAIAGDEPQALAAKSDKGYSCMINGKTVFFKEFLADNKTPKLDFNQDRLTICEKGFHTKYSWCSSCEIINQCVLIREERLMKMTGVGEK